MSEKKNVKIDSPFKAVALGVSATLDKGRELRSMGPGHVSTGNNPPANPKDN